MGALEGFRAALEVQALLLEVEEGGASVVVQRRGRPDAPHRAPLLELAQTVEV